jgi:hypothetical protein
MHTPHSNADLSSWKVSYGHFIASQCISQITRHPSDASFHCSILSRVHAHTDLFRRPYFYIEGFSPKLLWLYLLVLLLRSATAGSNTYMSLQRGDHLQCLFMSLGHNVMMFMVPPFICPLAPPKRTRLSHSISLHINANNCNFFFSIPSTPNTDIFLWKHILHSRFLLSPARALETLRTFFRIRYDIYPSRR